MIKLKQVIHDTKTNSVEATWVEVVTPAIDVLEHVEPDIIDDDGSTLSYGKVTPAHTIPAVEVQVRCHSYADVQMGMFRADVAQWGGDIAEHESLIAAVEAAIVPYVAPPPVIPASVTMRQARLALLGAGLLDAVELAIQSAGPAAKIEWEYAQEVQRSAGLVPAMAAALGMSDAQLDALFLQASAL